MYIAHCYKSDDSPGRSICSVFFSPFVLVFLCFFMDSACFLMNHELQWLWLSVLLHGKQSENSYFFVFFSHLNVLILIFFSTSITCTFIFWITITMTTVVLRWIDLNNHPGYIYFSASFVSEILNLILYLFIFIVICKEQSFLTKDRYAIWIWHWCDVFIRLYEFHKIIIIFKFSASLLIHKCWIFVHSIPYHLL